MTDELKPCPWGGTECVLVIRVEDDEGNYRGKPGCEYEENPWSGGPWYSLSHIGDCGCGADDFLFGRYSSVDELISAWNTRAGYTRQYEPIINPYGEITEYMCECGRCCGSVPNYCPSCGAKVVWDYE